MDTLGLLVEAGTDVNEASPGGYTPLITACKHSYKERGVSTISKLLDLGADTELPFNGRRNAAIRAIYISAAKD